MNQNVRLNCPPIKDYFAINVFLFKIVAIFECSTRESLFWKTINVLYAILVYLISMLTLALCVGQLIASWHQDFLYVAFILINNLVFVNQIVLITWLRTKREILRQIIRFANENFRFYSARGLANTTMNESFSLTRNIGIGFILFSIIGTQYWCIEVFFIRAEDGTRLLPLDLWYPLDVTVTPYYEIAYVFQCIIQIIVPSSYLSLTLFYVTACVLLCGQLGLLCCSLANIRFTAMLKTGVKYEILRTKFPIVGFASYMDNFCATPVVENSLYHYNQLNTYALEDVQDEVEGFLDIYSKIYDKEMERAVIECIEFHQMLNTFFDEFHAIVSTIISFKMVMITFHHGILLYHFILSHDVKILGYYLMSIFELFCFCYFGQCLIFESEKPATAIYLSHWWVCSDLRILRTLYTYVTVIRGRAYMIQGGHFYNMTIDTFGSVIKAAYSFLTFMRNAQNSN